jgi:membrane-associated protease RseP (regulator of RpoE activity)
MTPRLIIAAFSMTLSGVALAQTQSVPATVLQTPQAAEEHARIVEQHAQEMARAAEAHADNAHRVAELAEVQALRIRASFDDAEPGEKLAYLGVVVDTIDRSLGDHLDLPRGVGLIIESVLPESAAEQAGLQKNDVLHKLDDQLLVNSEQLSTLVRINKPGETVAVSFIRKGKSETISVVLGERVVKERTINSMVFSDPATPRIETPPLPSGVRDELRWLEQREPRVIRIRPGNDRSTVRTTDDRFVVTVERVNGLITAKVEDRAGKVLFEGPLNTDEEKARLPADLKQSVDSALADLPDLGIPATSTP